MQRRRLIAAAAALPCAAALPALAQRYPDKPLKLLIGFPPGQATDIVGRVWAERMQKRLGQAVVVENRPGQGGSLALAALAKSPPDGYTLMLSATASLVINPHLYKSVGYDTPKDFDAVATLVDLPMVLVAHPSAPYGTVAEWLKYAKANPGKLRYASSGNGTISHLGMELVKRQAGIDVVHIPYQGSARSMTDLIAGNVDIGLDTLAVTLPHVQSKRLKPIAVSTAERLAVLPDVPTLAESGLPAAAISPWLGLVAPHGTPAAVVARLSDETLAFVKDPATNEQLKTLGAVPRPGTSDDLRAVLAREYDAWGKVVRESGAKAD